MAVIVHLITGLETGGAERMLARLATGLDRERHRSIVVSMTGPAIVGQSLTSAGIELHTLDMRRGVADLRGVTRLARILRELQPDILQTWLYHADLLGTVAQLLGPPCALSWNVQCAESIDADIVRRLLVWCSARPDAVVVNSLAGKRFHEQLGYRPRRWEHIPNGCDTNLFRFDAEARLGLRRELGIPDHAVAIGLPARFHPMKDHDNFLAAAARLADKSACETYGSTSTRAMGLAAAYDFTSSRRRPPPANAQTGPSAPSRPPGRPRTPRGG